MRTSRRIIIFTWIVAGTFASVGMGEVRLFLVPQGEDPTADPVGPTEFIVRPREGITFDIFIASNEPLALKSLDVVLPRTPSCGELARGQVLDSYAFLDGNRPDYVFWSPGIWDLLPGLQPDTVRFPGGSSHPNNEGVIISEPKYCGEISYGFAADACGSFVVSFIEEPSESEFVTVLFDPNDEPIDFSAESTVFHLTQDGDTNRDGLVDILDIFCVLDAFAGQFVNCAFADADSAPCLLLRGDGAIDMDDIFAVLDAFKGIDACFPPCGELRCPL